MSRNGQSNLALILNIDQGLLCMYTPVRDSMRNVIPGQQGELIIRLEDATIFSVTAYKGNSNLGYVCAMIRGMSLDHCGLMTTPLQPPSLRPINSDIPQHCQNTIYKSGLNENVMGTNNNDDMVMLAIRIQAAHQTHRIKVRFFFLFFLFSFKLRIKLSFSLIDRIIISCFEIDFQSSGRHCKCYIKA